MSGACHYGATREADGPPALTAVATTARGANVPRAVAGCTLVRRQHVEGRVARSGNGLVEDLRPLGRDLSNVCVGYRFQVDDAQVIHAHPVAEVLTQECSVVEQRLVGRVRAVDEQPRIALVRGDVPTGEDRREERDAPVRETTRVGSAGPSVVHVPVVE